MALLISDKIDYRTRNISKNKERHYIEVDWYNNNNKNPKYVPKTVFKIHETKAVRAKIKK